MHLQFLEHAQGMYGMRRWLHVQEEHFSRLCESDASCGHIFDGDASSDDVCEVFLLGDNVVVIQNSELVVEDSLEEYLIDHMQALPDAEERQ